MKIFCRVHIVVLLFVCVALSLPPYAVAEAEAINDKKIDLLLRESWNAYRKHFIRPDGRVVDPDGDITTSEAQAYALLRAAFMNDQDTFTKVLLWTKRHLIRPDGQLFAWKWGERYDKSMGVLDEKSAADADEDIALALLIAACRWHNPELFSDAKRLIKEIWRLEVISANGKFYLGPGDWAKDMDKPQLNPSYFAPYAYRLFAQVDKDHDWLTVLNTSYSVLNRASDASRLALPPDWCELDRATGAVSVDMQSKESDYSYDAIRVPWRICLDWQWNHDPQAKAYLSRLSFLADSWSQTRTIRSAYAATGVMREFGEPLSGFACVLPLFALIAPEMAQEVLQERIDAQYYNGLWRLEDDYYGQNWAWFGIALMFNRLDCPKIQDNLSYFHHGL